MATAAKTTTAAGKAPAASVILARLAQIDESRRALAGERYKDSEVLLKAVKVVGEFTTPGGFKMPTVELGEEKKNIPLHRSATKGLDTYDIVVQVAPEEFKYLDRAGNPITVAAGTERYVLKDVA